MWALRLWGVEGGSARIENPTSQELSLKKRRWEQCMALQKADTLFRAVTVSTGGPGVTDLSLPAPQALASGMWQFAVLKAHQEYKD